MTHFFAGLLFTLVKYTLLLKRFCAANSLHCAVTLHYLGIPDLVLPNFFHSLTEGPLACVTSQNGFVVSSSNLNNGRFMSKITLTGRLSWANSHKLRRGSVGLLEIAGRVVHRDNKTWIWLRCSQDCAYILRKWLIIAVYISNRAILSRLLVEIFIYSSNKASTVWGNFFLTLT